jgi:hypothetical protein
MRCPKLFSYGLVAGLLGLAGPSLVAADQTVATAIYARVGNGYKRTRLPDGRFKPEYYAIANGGQVAGTTRDATVDRVKYPEVAAIAMRLLLGQNYHYAKSADQATLLLVLQWGSTISYNRENYDSRIQSVQRDLRGSGTGGWSLPITALTGGESVADAGGEAESAMYLMLDEQRARDRINLPNARLLGYLDEINDADGIQRYAGGGTRFDDLIADIEETRYYIIISAYDFQDLTKRDKRKLMWTTRVSVRAPGNRFDDSIMAMLKGASKYFGQETPRLIRGEETKGQVEMGDLKFLGEVKTPEKVTPEPTEGK